MTDMNRRALLRGFAIAPAMALPLVPAAMARPDLNGLGIIYINGEPVMFDSRDMVHVAGAKMLALEPGRANRHPYLTVVTGSENPERQPERPGVCRVDMPRFAGDGYPCVREIPLIGRVIQR